MLISHPGSLYTLCEDRGQYIAAGADDAGLLSWGAVQVMVSLI